MYVEIPLILGKLTYITPTGTRSLSQMENLCVTASSSFDIPLITSDKASFFTMEKDFGKIGTSLWRMVFVWETIWLVSTSRTRLSSVAIFCSLLMSTSLLMAAALQHRPVFGVHGSFLMTNGEMENECTWYAVHRLSFFWFAKYTHH